MSVVFVSCVDKLFGEFDDANRKIDDTNDHILLPDSFDFMLVEKSSPPPSFIVSSGCCSLSSTRRAVTRFFETFGVKIYMEIFASAIKTKEDDMLGL